MRYVQIVMVCALVVSTLLTVNVSQAQRSKFPSVVSVQIVNDRIGIGAQLSNSGRFVYLPSGEADESSIVDRQAVQAFPKNVTSLGYAGRTNPAGWSIHDARFVEVDPGKDCQYPILESEFFIFETATKRVSQFCMPFIGNDNLSASWSPFSEDMILFYYVDKNYLVNIKTREVNIVPFLGILKPENIAQFTAAGYVGYGNYLWDRAKEIPIAEVERRFAYSQSMPVLESFDLCPVSDSYSENHCAPFLDMSAYQDIDVFAWKFSTASNLFLWAGNQKTSEDSSWCAQNTVIYLTDVASGVTQELFRLSRLKNVNIRAERSIDWTPDGKTIMLSLEHCSKDRPYASGVISSLLITLT